VALAPFPDIDQAASRRIEATAVVDALALVALQNRFRRRKTAGHGRHQGLNPTGGSPPIQTRGD
jgi:hypothetical protein